MASARAWIVTAVLLACLLAGPTEGWFERRRRCPPPPCPSKDAVVRYPVNDWDKKFTYQCPRNRAISRVQSVHCNTAEDRVWRFECKPVGFHAFTYNYWTGWINDYDEDMAFNCPYNTVVTGFQSEHSNSRHDRRWKMRCSKKIGMVLHSCYTTWYVNYWDRAMDYFVPASYYVTGMHGEHRNNKGDRRYKFTLCKVTP
ncbi:hypothetical protein Bbelb_094540 [Branchiostoma belcheri]|nr:hypothetical protein Bbelb_094540 [Branchiostoma belcheri]